MNRVSEILSYRDAERRGLTTEDAEGTEGGKRAKARGEEERVQRKEFRERGKGALGRAN